MKGGQQVLGRGKHGGKQEAPAVSPQHSHGSLPRCYLRDSVVWWVPPYPQQVGHPSDPQPSELILNLGDEESEKSKERKAGRARVVSRSDNKNWKGQSQREKHPG